MISKFKMLLPTVFVNLAVAGSLVLAGCGGGGEPTKAPPTQTPTKAAGTATPLATTGTTATAVPTKAPTASAATATPAPTATKPPTTPTASGETPKMGGSLKIGIQNMDGELNPHTFVTGYSQHISQRFLETLTWIDRSGGIEPMLAESWQVSPDAKTFTFKLRQGVQFHDGSKLDAAAVKWLLEKAMEKGQSPATAQMVNVVSVEAPDSATVKLTMKQSDGVILFGLAASALSPMPAASFGDGKLRSAQYVPLGTGPFKVVGQRAADRASLQRFDGYWKKGVTYLDTMQFFKITDPTVKLAAVRAGDVDLIEAAPLDAASTVFNATNLGYLMQPGTIGSTITFRNDIAPFDNVHVRKAWAYAIDRESINKVVFAGLGLVNANYEWLGHWGYDPNFKPVPKDIAKAKAELALAGYPNGLKVTVMAFDRNPQAMTAQVVQQQMAAAGIEVVLDSMDSVKIGNLMRDGGPASHGITVGSQGARDAEPLARLGNHHSQAPLNSRDGHAYKIPELDTLFDTLRTSADMAVRKKTMYRVNEIMMVEQVMKINIVDIPDFYVWNAKLRGVETGYSYPLKINSAWWADTARPGSSTK